MLCTPHHHHSGNQIKKNEMGGGVRTGFWRGDLREGDHMEDPGVGGTMILKQTLKKWDRRAWTGLFWLRTGTGGGIL
jgi:hypothetical protein